MNSPMCDYGKWKAFLTTFPQRQKTSKLDNRCVLVPPHSDGTYFFLSVWCFIRVHTLFLGKVNNSAREVGQNILHKVSGVHRAGNSDVVLRNITWKSQRNGIDGEIARSRQRYCGALESCQVTYGVKPIPMFFPVLLLPRIPLRSGLMMD